MNEDLIYGIVTLTVIFVIALFFLKLFIAVAGPVFITLTVGFVVYKVLKWISQ
tara:strand:+ start:91 stop:249 length:159 start_codon:yes stop_codon:yes gene_type:complete